MKKSHAHAQSAARHALRDRHANQYRLLYFSEKVAVEPLVARLRDLQASREVRNEYLRCRERATMQLIREHSDEYQELLHYFKHRYRLPHKHEADEHEHAQLMSLTS